MSNHCVNEMAENLERFRGVPVIVFEKNAIMLGTVKVVLDDLVLVLKDVIKYTSIGDQLFQVEVPRLFVSICDITEFAPIDPDSRSTFLNSNQLDAIKVL